MSRADFEDFIKRKRVEEAGDIAFDSGRQLAEWLIQLDILYGAVEGFLSEYVAEKTAWIEFRPITLNEEFSGVYEARKMLLHIAGSTITFEPIGTMVIGSKGRVDVRGPRGRARLSLVDRRFTDARQLVQIRVSTNGEPSPSTKPTPDTIDWVWKIATPVPDLRFLDLTEDNFFDMILGVADA